MANTLRTFKAVSEVGDEFTVEQSDCGRVGPTFGDHRVEFTCPALGPLQQIGPNLFQVVARPELILTEKTES
jgi:hypothetical protein